MVILFRRFSVPGIWSRGIDLHDVAWIYSYEEDAKMLTGSRGFSLTVVPIQTFTVSLDLIISNLRDW